MKVRPVDVTNDIQLRFQFRIEKRLEDCNIDAWTAVTQASPLFLRPPFLLALERNLPAALEPRYGVLSDAHGAAAVLVGQILTVQADRIPRGPDAAATPRWAKAVVAHMQTRVFLWGNFVGWGFSGIALRPGVDPTLLWPCIAEAIDRAPQLDASIRRASIQLVLDLSASDLDGGRELERFRFQALMAEPDMVLALDPGWQSFDDYRGALKAKYRKASVEMDKQLLQAGCTVEKLADTRQFAGELQALHLKVHEQSAFRFVSFPRGFIPALQENLGSDFICTVVRQGERILGFITTLIDGDTALAYVVGHDVEANRELPVYLRLLQSAIEDGIARGCKRITYGRTALEPKARLGATPVALTLYGRHKSKLMGPLLTPLLQALAPKAGPPPRNPFKETARPDRPEGVSPRPCAARTPRP